MFTKVFQILCHLVSKLAWQELMNLPIKQLEYFVWGWSVAGVAHGLQNRCGAG